MDVDVDGSRLRVDDENKSDFSTSLSEFSGGFREMPSEYLRELAKNTENVKSQDLGS
jgi:hypothetical protein